MTGPINGVNFFERPRIQEVFDPGKTEDLPPIDDQRQTLRNPELDLSDIDLELLQGKDEEGLIGF